MLPTLFLSHGGGPAHVLDYTGSAFAPIDRNSKSAAFLRSLPQKLEEYTPISSIRAILVVSAHWEEPEFTIDYQDKGKTKLVYDYYGFGKEAYEPYLTYPAPTDLHVADRVFELLRQNNIPARKQNRGWDHGTFMPLLVSFPEAKIPIVQLSLKAGLQPSEHFRLGEILRPLRQEGVLIIGSGQITHNLGALGRDGSSRTDPRAKAFLDFIYQTLTNIHSEEDYLRMKELFTNRIQEIPHFQFHHPRTEHFVPLLVAVAAGVKSTCDASQTLGSTPTSSSSPSSMLQTTRLYTEIVMTNMGIDSYLFM